MDAQLLVWPFLFGAMGIGLGAAVTWLVWTAPVQAELARLLDERDALELERARLEGRLEAEDRAHAARLDELARMGEELEARFATLAGDVLGRNSEAFLRLVSERFEVHRREADQELDARRQAVEALVQPIAESLARFEGRIGELERAREGAYRAITEQVRMLAEGQQMLRSETHRLVDALRRPKTRGRWGEFQLENVLQLAGLTEHVDFVRERSLNGDAGRLRPDVIIRLPGGKSLAVDAKTPLDAYLAAIEAGDGAQRADALLRHARQLRAHVRALSSKEYWRALNESLHISPDFVVMFIPGEAFFAAAIEQDPGLFEEALAQKVLICTPTTFVALVKAIAYGWQQEKLAENTLRVAQLGRELHGRMCRFVETLARVGGSLQHAVDRYNESLGTLQARVMPTLRRFETLGVAAESGRVGEVAPVETGVRDPAAMAEARTSSGDS